MADRDTSLRYPRAREVDGHFIEVPTLATRALIAFIACSLVCIDAAFGDVPYQAAPRSDENSRIAHQQLLEKKTRGKIDIFLHLALDGYQIWADALKPIFTEVLGPPAAVDRAPPPTGDPSAAPRTASPH